MLPFIDGNVALFGGRLRTLGGLLIVGIALGHVVLTTRARRARLASPLLVELYSAATVGAALGVSYLVSPWLAGPSALASVPALVGGVMSSVLLARAFGISYPRVADAAAYAFPFGWFWARLGCALVHDHVGMRSSSPLAVRFPDGARYDLGVLELLGTAILCAGTLVFAKRIEKRGPGRLALGMAISYAGLRFLVELAREDTHGFNAVQWVALLVLAVASAALVRAPRMKEHRDTSGQPGGERQDDAEPRAR